MAWHRLVPTTLPFLFPELFPSQVRRDGQSANIHHGLMVAMGLFYARMACTDHEQACILRGQVSRSFLSGVAQ